MIRLWVALVCLAFTGCFFPADRGRIVEDRLETLSADNQKLRAELTETRGKLEDTTAQLQTALDQLDRASRTTDANMGVKVDTALQDMAVLRGQVESQQFKLQELETKVGQAPVAGSGGSTPTEPKKEELKKPDEPGPFLALANEKAKAGEIELSRSLFNELMKKWPRDPLVGEAHFALGETYFDEKKCREALYEYGKVIQDFPKTKSSGTAYLRSADCFRQLKMTDEARLTLEQLIKGYPSTDAAKQARTKLAELKKKK